MDALPPSKEIAGVLVLAPADLIASKVVAARLHAQGASPAALAAWRAPAASPLHRPRPDDASCSPAAPRNGATVQDVSMFRTSRIPEPKTCFHWPKNRIPCTGASADGEVWTRPDLQHTTQP